MNRRTFLKLSAAAVAAAVAIPTVALPTESDGYEFLGRVKAGTPLVRRLKDCTVDGVSVWKIGYDGNDIEGWVDCRRGIPRHWETDAENGVSVLVPGRVEKWRVRGKVRFTLKDEA